MPIKSTEEIRTELSKYYKKRKHVLLYGNSCMNPKNLVLDVHIENGGKTDTVQYVGREKEEVFLEKMAEAIKNDRLKNKDERKRYKQVREKYESSEKSWRPLKGIHQVGYEVWHIVRIPLSCGMSLEIKGDEFLDFKGTLFVDMSDYDPDKDAEYLCKLADDIKEGNVSWLVVYIYNGRDYAPESFLKQFKHICLDGEGAVVEPVKEVAEPEVEEKTGVYNWSIDNARDIFCNGKRITELPPLQFKLFKCLQKRHGKNVKSEVLERCWKNKKPDYVNFLSTEMSKIGSKLKRGLEENNIKIDGDVIERKKGNRRNIAYKLVTKS